MITEPVAEKPATSVAGAFIPRPMAAFPLVSTGVWNDPAFFCMREICLL